ncbi:DUF3078 domain-containing protein [Maribellus mangrovi]|uniref:DUF3078 domain-containing protein n=1 Tax=Maribellus mangrovi TaxID=3133146 RepID=UPI0030ED3014
MKKLLIILMLIPFALFAQQTEQDTLWETSTTASANFSQVSLTNWAAGGKSSMSGLFMLNYAANYKKDKLSWDNSFDLRYGFIKEKDTDTRKSDDLIDISSKLGLEAGGNWNYAALLGFKSQFASGYNYDNDPRELISKFMAPGYLNLAAGMDYKTDGLSMLISPVSGKFTFVTADDINEEDFGLDAGKKVRGEFGATFKLEYKKEVWTNVTFETTLNLFSNYLDNPQNVDVDWKTQFNMKINDYLSANLITHLIYDDDVKIEDPDTGTNGARLQFMESFGVGLTYKF